jgi:glutathione S-transferase
VRTRLVLNGKGIEYELVDVDLSDKPAWLRDLNPRNRVPVMKVDGQVLTESEALDEFLDEYQPQPAMMPADPIGRARVRALMRRFEDFSSAFYNARRGEDGAEEELRAQLSWLDERLSAQPYLAGDQYSLAEPGWWPWVSRLSRIGVDVADYPAVAAWSARLEQRPEYAAELTLLAV